ncbi:hypothetical protein PO124_26860 [Bacillus licheniformis]|nr:hypothetical protein [Bacillus licheniformis]
MSVFGYDLYRRPHADPHPARRRIALVFIAGRTRNGRTSGETYKGVYDRGSRFAAGNRFAASIATALVPSLTKAKKREKLQCWRKDPVFAKMSFVIGTGAAAGLICILEPVNVMLFKTAMERLRSKFQRVDSLCIAGDDDDCCLQGLGNTCLPAVFVCCGIW